jgi:hypothetical protein
VADDDAHVGQSAEWYHHAIQHQQDGNKALVEQLAVQGVGVQLNPDFAFEALFKLLCPDDDCAFLKWKLMTERKIAEFLENAFTPEMQAEIRKAQIVQGNAEAAAAIAAGEVGDVQDRFGGVVLGQNHAQGNRQQRRHPK